MGVELLRPEALWGFLLALPLVLFHLYHRRRVVAALENAADVLPGHRAERIREHVDGLAGDVAVASLQELLFPGNCTALA